MSGLRTLHRLRKDARDGAQDAFARRLAELRLAEELLRRASMEDGQAMVEYALLLSLLSLVAFGAVNEFGLGVSSLYSRIVAVYP